jgi:hypothetical protein
VRYAKLKCIPLSRIKGQRRNIEVIFGQGELERARLRHEQSLYLASRTKESRNHHERGAGSRFVSGRAFHSSSSAAYLKFVEKVQPLAAETINRKSPFVPLFQRGNFPPWNLNNPSLEKRGRGDFLTDDDGVIKRIQGQDTS